jgi:hypothetical protein
LLSGRSSVGMSQLIAQLAVKGESPKVAETKAEKPSEAPKIPEKVDTEPPLSIYEKMKGVPYTAEHFGLTQYMEIDPEMDVKDYKGKAKEIDRWISDRIKENKLEDTLESYKSYIDRYKSELGIAKTLKNEEKVERIYAYIKLLKKQHTIDERRRELLDGFRNK